MPDGCRTAAPFDEMVTGAGGLRPHWRAILGTFHGLDDGGRGGGGLHARARRLDRAAEEEDALTARAEGPCWRCDPVPLPLGGGEFARLAAGLAQRARLLCGALDDLYGAQSLLADGVLPPALVYANPGFLRPCRGEPSAPRMNFYAGDLVRGPEGAWRVVADRTGAPAGLAAARENRRLLGRVVPELFRSVQLRPLRPFFDRWQDVLHRLAPADVANPAVALLTSGTAHPSWPEHLFLARELSIPLVQAGDLALRGGRLFLKTLGGLRPIDVLLRRVDGRGIDPLELDGAPEAGVPGLLEAARSGRVRITNDPGSALAEAPALAAFMPALARHLLGETLLLPGVETLWLGDEAGRARLRREPDCWLLRPAADSSLPAIRPATLSAAARADLDARIAEAPWAWAAVAATEPSVAPCLVGDALEPRPVMLRLFLVGDLPDPGADEPAWRAQAWEAMPGGLARVVEPGRPVEAGMARGGLSKDVWVIEDSEIAVVGPEPLAVGALELRRSSGDLPSRVADNLFWLGRTVERLDRAARLSRAAAARLARSPTLLPHQTAELAMLARCLIEAALIDPERLGAATGPAGPSGLAQALLATLVAYPGGASVTPPVERLFAEVARLIEGVRDRLTPDMHAGFVQMLAAARADSGSTGGTLDGLLHAMVGIQRFCTAVAGIAAENMVRGGAFLFLDLGRRLERAMSVAAEAAVVLDQVPARIEPGLALLLELCDSVITYRGRYLHVVQPAPVLDLVLADPGNPRGLAFQLAAMHGLLDELAPDDEDRETRALFAGAVAGLLARTEAMVDGVLRADDQASAASALPPAVRGMAAEIGQLSDRIGRRYFALLPTVQAVGWRGAPAPREAAPVE